MKECDTMININDETISQYLEFKLNKENSYFTKEELNSIKEIVINPIDLSGNERSVNLDYIKELPSLEKLDVLNMHVNQNNIQDITKLTKLTSLTFNNCELETPELISNLKLKNLSIINCKLKKIDFIYNILSLTSLTLIGTRVEIKKLNNLQNLEMLNIAHTYVEDMPNKLELPSLITLIIDNSNINDLSILSDLKNLSNLSVDEKIFQLKKQLTKKLNIICASSIREVKND